jgi:hypothetical protein
MKPNINEELLFTTSLILLKRTEEPDAEKISIKVKLLQIAKLTRDNEELKEKLENLQTRATIETHPYLVEFFNARILNLELLETGLNNKRFKRKEREKIIQLIIQGAVEIWQMGEYRAASFLKTYLYGDEKIKEKKEEFQFKEEFEEKEKAKAKPQSAKKSDVNRELKNLYLKLVKLVHPDREMDETKKLEKNLLMKRVTEAYEKEDLHALLLIMAEFTDMKEPMEGKLETYIKALNKKLKDLKDQKLFLMKWGPLADVYQMLYSRNPKKVDAKIRAQVNEMKDRVQKEEFFGDIYSDDLYLKSFLKELLIQEEDLE